MIGQNRYRLITALTAVLLWLNICLTLSHAAEKTGIPQTGFGRHERDSIGKVKQLNYDLDLTPIGESGLLFRDLANQNLLIYNFSAGCHHCISTAPYIKKLSDTLSVYGFIFVGIAVSRNKKPDIVRFVEEQKLEIIMFQDSNWDFSKTYGMDGLPIVMLVGKNGNYMRGVMGNTAFQLDQIKKAVFEKQLFP